MEFLRLLLLIVMKKMLCVKKNFRFIVTLSLNYMRAIFLKKELSLLKILVLTL